MGDKDGISEMFQKLALAFKSKTIDFFADDDSDAGADEVITGQPVVVLRPDRPDKVAALHALLSSLFAALAAFKAAYLHLQIAHAPFVSDEIHAADRAAVSHLHLLSRLKHSFQTLHSLDVPPCCHLEAEVQENQSLLHTFDLVINRLQSEIDRKDAEVSSLRQRLEKIEFCNLTREKRLLEFDSASPELLLSVGLFDSVLQDVCRSAHGFTKLLVEMMKKAGLDLNLTANSLYPGIQYAKRVHNRYALLSFVCLRMFSGFNLENFGLESIDSSISESLNFGVKRWNYLLQFVEHGSVDVFELLEGNSDCEFARFCVEKYKKLISPDMGLCLFEDLGGKELAADLWGTFGPLYNGFVNMASLVWMLHKLAFSFDPTVEVFQVERGSTFSIVYMQNVARRGVLSNSGPGKARGEVGFTVIPGFKVGKTVIQCQVYLSGSKHELVKVEKDTQ